MKITVVSDLHLEFSDCYLKNEQEADVLILSGDIMVAQCLHDHKGRYNLQEPDIGSNQIKAQIFRDFLSRCSFQFPHVIYVAGNHEFYHGKFHAGLDYLREECDRFPNVYFLERDTKIIDDVVFVGGTLWTDMNRGDPLTMHAVSDMMSDYRIIRNDKKAFSPLKPLDTVMRHKETLGYFKLVLDEHKDKKCVVVGHHTPSPLSIHEMYKDQYIMNGAYTSDLSEFILDRPQIKLWTHGHTHHCFDYMIGETRIVCNPRGYHSDRGSEDTGWNSNLVIEI
jgi:Icc-related predicted phosphoesterase